MNTLEQKGIRFAARHEDKARKAQKAGVATMVAGVLVDTLSESPVVSFALLLGAGVVALATGVKSLAAKGKEKCQHNRRVVDCEKCLPGKTV